MQHICLISCVGKKAGHACPAEDLYISDWFKKARAFDERNSNRWFILSAEFGLVEPHEVLPPYEKTLNTMVKEDRYLWSLAVAQEFNRLVREPASVTILAGAKYRQMLVPLLRAAGHKVDVPMEGLKIGEQLSWLASHV